MAEQNPVVQRYLEQFRSSLSHLPEPERHELVREIESHIAEATSAGRPLAEVLTKLGPADRLARAYSAELLLNARPRDRSRVNRWFAVAGLLLTTSLVSVILIPLLGGVGIGFAIGGAAMLVAGVAALFMPWLMFVPVPLPYGVPQALTVAIGLLLAALGIGALYLLRLYIMFLIRAVRTVAA